MKPFYLILALLLAGATNHWAALLVRVKTDAIPDSIPPAPHGHKFLILMDISKSMSRFEEGGRKSLFELIDTGLYGHMQTGDSFGLWTYNNQLFSGEFAMQVWDPTNHTYLATTATNYVGFKEYDGRARLDFAMQSVTNIVAGVKDVTILILSDDRARMVGTAFDDTVNKLYDKLSREMKRVDRPMVTTLIARAGQFASAGVTVAGNPLPLPQRPPPTMPWPPPPEPEPAPVATLVATNAPSLSPTGKRSSTQSTGRSIYISQSTIQRERDELLASLNTSFDKTPTTTTSLTPTVQDTLAKDTSATIIKSNLVLVGPNHTATTISAGASNGTALAHASAKPASDTLISSLLPKPVEVAAREPSTNTGATTNAASANPVLGALGAPSAMGRKSWWWIGLGAGCLILGCALFVWSLSRRRSHTSFITQSMHR